MSKEEKAVSEERLQIAQQAAKRWEKRVGIRKSEEEAVKNLGPGAADTLAAIRHYELNQVRRVIGLERMVGPTWDATSVAPNEAAQKFAKPVARITTFPGEGYAPQGFATGFMVSPRLMLTNHHVFKTLESARGMTANFLYVTTPQGVSQGVYFDILPDEFYFSDEELDFALVAINPKAKSGESLSEFGYIQMIGAPGKTLKFHPINMIYHPEGGPRQYAFKENQLLDVLDEGYLHYATDTAPACSGAPCINEFWELVALHHCSIPEIRDGEILDKNGRPWNSEGQSEDEVHWVANEGVRISAIVAKLKGVEKVSGDKSHLEQLLAISPSDRVDEHPLATPSLAIASAMESSKSKQSHMPSSLSSSMNNTFNFSGPVTINIFSPQSSASVPEATLEAVESKGKSFVALEAKQTFDPRYDLRKGYDSNFLGIQLPLPFFIEERLGELYCVGDYKAFAATDRQIPEVEIGHHEDHEPLEIKYHHYSLVFNKEYRMAAWTASNSDYTEEMRSDPRNREEFGGENWKPDPRVPLSLQLKDADIYGPATNLDRGHIVRREDNCWGALGNETAYGNADSYHWTNCCGQHELFNQENPKGYSGQKGIWGQFEGALQKEITDSGGQMTLFAGPVLSDECPTKDFGRGPVRYPLRFWKVVAIPDSKGRQAKLKAYGFVFDQSEAIKKYGIGFEESLKLPEFKKERKSLLEIQEITGVVFPQVLLDADQYKVG